MVWIFREKEKPMSATQAFSTKKAAKEWAKAIEPQAVFYDCGSDEVYVYSNKAAKSVGMVFGEIVHPELHRFKRKNEIGESGNGVNSDGTI